MKYVVGGAVALVVMALLLLGLPNSIRSQADDQKCRLRLYRLGRALNEWVMDHGFRAFPPITNHPEAQDWHPQRPGTVDVVLKPYLYRNRLLPNPARGIRGESEEEYLAALRKAQPTVCPLTNRPFWFNEGLRVFTPSDVANGDPARVIYFASPRLPDGSWSARTTDGRPATHAVYGTAEHAQVTAAEVATYRGLVEQAMATDPTSPDAHAHRRRLEEMERRLKQAGGEVFTMATLRAERVTEPRD